MAVPTDELNFYKKFAPFPVIGGTDGTKATFVDKFPTLDTSTLTERDYGPGSPYGKTAPAGTSSGVVASGASYTSNGITFDFQDPSIAVTGGSSFGAGAGGSGVADVVSEGSVDPYSADFSADAFDAASKGAATVLGSGGTGTASSTWWQNLLTNIQDLSIRGGLGMLALVLIAAAAFAFTFGHGSLKEAAANTAKTAAKVIK